MLSIVTKLINNLVAGIDLFSIEGNQIISYHTISGSAMIVCDEQPVWLTEYC